MTHQRPRLSLLLATVLIVATLSIGAVASPAGAQTIPPAYYGTVQVEGEDAATDVVVEAVVDGTVVDSIGVDPAGQYGGPGPGDGALVVRESDGSGDDFDVTFQVNGPGYSEAARTVTFDDSQSPQQVDLSVADVDQLTDIELQVDPTTLDLDDTTTADVAVLGDFDNGTTGVDITNDDSVNIEVINETVATLSDPDAATITAQNLGATSVEATAPGTGGQLTDSTVIDVVEDADEEPPEEEGGDDTGPGGGPSPGPGTGDDGAEDEAPPSVEEVRSTLNLVDPATQTSSDIVDDNPDTPGISVQIEEAQSVGQITFNNEELSGTVDVTEYTNPPQQIVEDVARSVADQVGNLRLHTDNTLDDSRTVQSDSADINVLTVNDITVNSDSEDTSATVELSVDRNRVNNPQNLVIVKEGFDEAEQTERWSQLETTIQEVNEEEVIVEAQVPDFSLFAVAEVEPADDGSQQVDADDDGGEEPPAPDEDGPSTILIIAILAVIALVGGAAYYIGRQSGDN